MTMIAGAPGTGKTATITHYLQSASRSYLVEAVSGEGGIWSAATLIFKALDLGEPNSRNLQGDRQKIADAIGADGLLVIDEAQNLIQRNTRGKDNTEAFEWLRNISEMGCFSIAFVGDLSLSEVVEKLPQFKRPLRRPIIVRRVSKSDVEAVAGRSGFFDPAVIDVLFSMAKRGGGLGDVANVLAHAALFSAGAKVEGFHIIAAIEDPQLSPKGGK